MPVTAKAQESESYQDYLSRSGEDNTTYYDVKLQATKLLLSNTDNTFVTPVFNGSTSLRDAAGQLVENTVKGSGRCVYRKAVQRYDCFVPPGSDRQCKGHLGRTHGTWKIAENGSSSFDRTGYRVDYDFGVCRYQRGEEEA